MGLEILVNPNPILKNRSLELDDLNDPEIKKLIPLMVRTMLEADGVGLAAPQIGKNIRLIIVQTKDGPKAFINPQILKHSIFKEWNEEGCLSVPGMFGQVKRFRKLTIQAFDQHGKLLTLDTKGLLARIFQHEIDHLNGTLIIDKTKNLRSIIKHRR